MFDVRYRLIVAVVLRTTKVTAEIENEEQQQQQHRKSRTSEQQQQQQQHLKYRN